MPPIQKRVAHLGASDFLFRQLNDPEGALRELQAIDDLGLADAPGYERIAVIAEAARKFEMALTALDHAVACSTYREAARYTVQAVTLRQTYLQDTPGAIASYRRAIAKDPANLHAASTLVDLLPNEDGQIIASGFEDTVRAAIARGEIEADTIRKLRHAAAWRQKSTAQALALSALNALRIANHEEEQAWQAMPKRRLR